MRRRKTSAKPPSTTSSTKSSPSKSSPPPHDKSANPADEHEHEQSSELSEDSRELSKPISKSSLLKKIGMTTHLKNAIITYFIHFMCIHTVYWAIGQIYHNWCIPSGIAGYIKSITSHGSFICIILHTLLDYSHKGIQNMAIYIISGIGTVGWLKFSNKKGCYCSANEKKDDV